MKIRLLVLIPLVLLLTAGALTLTRGAGFLSGLIPGLTKAERSFSWTNMTGLRELDRLHTAFLVTPVPELSLGLRKREQVREKISVFLPGSPSPEKQIMGGCVRVFEVSFGYERIGRILADPEAMRQLCALSVPGLPPPSILDINGVEMRRFGKYDGACEEWDQDRERLEARIREELLKHDLYAEIEGRGRLALANLARPLCKAALQ